MKTLNIYNELEALFIKAAKELREDLSSYDNPANYMSLSLEADGRVMDGELKIKFILSDGSYGSEAKAEGGKLYNVVKEFSRRYEWKTTNSPLCISKVEDENPETEEKVPF